MLANMDVDHEIELLKTKIKELGQQSEDGTWNVKFGVLFKGKSHFHSSFNIMTSYLRMAL